MSLAWHRFVPTAIPEDEREEVMQLAPVPAFLVYDGFLTDLQAEEVYECLLSLTDQTPTWLSHAKVFLCTCIVKQNTRDPTAHIDQTTYLCMAPPETKKWASQQFNHLYPVVLLSPSAQPQSTGTSEQAMQELLIQ
eukprot:6204199-Ditylum_brightwellii.AAC.1